MVDNLFNQQLEITLQRSSIFMFLCIVKLTKAALVSANSEIILGELERCMTCMYTFSIHKLTTNTIKSFTVINADLHNISDHLAVSATLQLQKIDKKANMPSAMTYELGKLSTENKGDICM